MDGVAESFSTSVAMRLPAGLRPSLPLMRICLESSPFHFSHFYLLAYKFFLSEGHWPFMAIQL